jgi:LDH2 family malate/lactate/ureidoglycolate dehydrogenase
VAIPAGDEAPVILDAAFAAAARGRIVLSPQAGGVLPEGWALDRDGNPATDPAAALSGLIQPIDDFKGSLLAVVFGLMASAFAGASFGSELGEIESGPVPNDDGLLAMALDPKAFGAPGAFGSRVSVDVRRLRDDSPTPTNDRVRLPGDRVSEYKSAARESDILLPEATSRELVELCRALGVDAPEGLD